MTEAGRAKNYITPDGLRRLIDERRFLLSRERPAVTQVVAWAASNGDRSENADYQYGKRRLREIDRRIRFLTKRIDAAHLVDPEGPRAGRAATSVFFGATVRYADAAGTVRVVSIVGVDEVDLDRNHISWRSPLARALMKSGAGDRVLLRAPGGTQQLHILEVRYERVPVKPFSEPPGAECAPKAPRIRLPSMAVILLVLATAAAARAQGVDAGDPRVTPPPPALPAVFVRGDDGRSTIRAVRIKEPLTLDGRLDEAAYAITRPASGFIQQEPLAGTPATEDTEVWIFFDDDNVYVGMRCLDSRPDRIVANEMRRDNGNIFQNDSVTVVFDTFYDRRGAFFFQTNPLGGLRDALVVRENTTNFDWNTVWDVKTSRFDGGWTVEMAIPFKSLRYPRNRPQIWGFNARRGVRAKNEHSLLAPVPRSYLGNGVQNLSIASTLVGIEPPPASRNIELKPSLMSGLTTNRAAAVPFSNRFDKSYSVDAKYGLTNSMILDFTYKTDFAQVEIDEQQVNLTRFSLFFPEKREFFLEGQNVFDFAGTGVAGRTDVPILFFSRRIGLQGQPVPILGGARLTGRMGRTSIGLLNIHTEDAPAVRAAATGFLVARLKRDVLRRSSIGLIATRRTPSLSGAGTNDVYGADANMTFYTNLQINGYYARSATTGLRGDADSYRGQFNYAADRYGVQFERVKNGPAFNPEVGFVRRPNTRRTLSVLRFSPRPRSMPGVRKLSFEGAYDRFVDDVGILQTELAQGEFRTDFESADAFVLNFNANYEFLNAPFRIARGVTVPVGGFHFNAVETSYVLGPQRRVSGTISANRGRFYGGDRTGVAYSGRLNLTSQLTVEPRLSLDSVQLPQGDFTTKLAGARTTYTISPRMAASALVQYNSSLNTIESNARFRWEYQPGSDLFVVYTDGRDTTDRRLAELVNRGVAIKFSRLFRF